MRQKIFEALKGNGSLTTRQLADSIGEDRNSVYRHCKRLEKENRLKSTLVQPRGKTRYFFPMTRETMTADNYERLTHMDREVAKQIRAFSFPGERVALASALEATLEQLGESVPGERRDAFEEFAVALLELARTAGKRSEVRGEIGFRPSNPPQRLWELGPQQSLL